MNNIPVVNMVYCEQRTVEYVNYSDRIEENTWYMEIYQQSLVTIDTLSFAMIKS